MPYTKPRDWVDGFDGKTPITAADLNRIEDGITATTVKADAAATATALAAVKTTADAAATATALAAVKATADAALPKTTAASTYATATALAAVKATADAALPKTTAASTYATATALAAVKATADSASAASHLVSTWSGSGFGAEVSGAKIVSQRGVSFSIASGDSRSQTITFEREFSALPVIVPVIEAGQEMKASICYWGLSKKNVTVRIDNLGTQAGWAQPIVVAIGVVS